MERLRFEAAPAPKESAPVAEPEKLREHYTESSWEGRTSEEFQKMKEELRKAPTLDFEQYFGDKDYSRLIHSNPRMQELLNREAVYTLLSIYGHAADIGLQEEQMHKIIENFEPPVKEQVQEMMEMEKTVREIAQEGT